VAQSGSARARGANVRSFGRALACLGGALALAGGCATAPQPVTKIVDGRIVVTRPVSAQAYEHVTRALIYEQEERWEEAAQELQRALPFDDEAAEVRAHLAELFVRLGRLDDAAEQIGRSLEIAPTVRGRLAAAELAEARHDRKGALSELRAAVELSVSDRDAEAVERTHLALAEAELGMLDARAAYRTVRALCDVALENVRGRVQLAALAWALGRPAEAEARLGESLALEPGELDARLMLGALYAATGRADKAKAAFREAIERAEGAPEIAEMYLRWLRSRGDAAEAGAEADRLVPDAIGEDTVELAVRIERAAGRPERAKAAADKALERGARPARVALLVAGALADLKDRSAAAARLLTIPHVAAEHVEARLRAAELLREEGKLAEAEKALGEAAVAIAAGGTGAAGKPAAGKPEAGIAGAPGSTARDWAIELAIARALLDEKRGDAARAARTLDAALAEAPQSPRLLLVRAAVDERRGEWKRALTFAARVLEDDPRHVEALNFHGFVSADHGFELPAAMRRLEVAMALDPGAGGIVDSLGWAYLRAGNRARAQELLVEADRLEPGDPEILEHLGDLYAQGQDAARALAAYREALRHDPSERLAREIEARVRDLEAKSAAGR
jgi:Tfp pilus assembly protein PilF